MSRVTIILRTSTLGYHPGQIVILEDSKMIRGIIASGHAELVWEDIEYDGGHTSSTSSSERPEATGPSGSNGTQPESRQRPGGDSGHSTFGGSERIRYPWDTQGLLQEDFAADYEGRETD